MVKAIKSRGCKFLHLCHLPIIDNCGTGGDLLNTFNISPTSALIASSCKKIVVAKHGNRSLSSLSGSADFFEYIGYHLDSDILSIVKSIEQLVLVSLCS